MTNWLPDDEGAQLRFAFDADIKRLEAAGTFWFGACDPCPASPTRCSASGAAPQSRDPRRITPAKSALLGRARYA
jgi:hypothetical protein